MQPSKSTDTLLPESRQPYRIPNNVRIFIKRPDALEAICEQHYTVMATSLRKLLEVINNNRINLPGGFALNCPNPQVVDAATCLLQSVNNRQLTAYGTLDKDPIFPELKISVSPVFKQAEDFLFNCGLMLNKLEELRAMQPVPFASDPDCAAASRNETLVITLNLSKKWPALELNDLEVSKLKTEIEATRKREWKTWLLNFNISNKKTPPWNNREWLLTNKNNGPIATLALAKTEMLAAAEEFGMTTQQVYAAFSSAYIVLARIQQEVVNEEIANPHEVEPNIPRLMQRLRFVAECYRCAGAQMKRTDVQGLIRSLMQLVSVNKRSSSEYLLEGLSPEQFEAELVGQS